MQLMLRTSLRMENIRVTEPDLRVMLRQKLW